MSTKILDYVPQPNSYTCQSACCGKVTGNTDVMAIRSQLEQLGEPGDPAVMGRFLRPLVQEYEFVVNASINDMIGYLKDGYTLITHGYFSASGHVICLVGHKDGYFEADDPYGELDASRWKYTANENGNNLWYSETCIYAACVGSYSAADADSIYNSGVIDKDQRNAWIHKVKN